MSNRRKSSYSTGNGGNCVAVGTHGHAVYVEDTKQDGLAQRDRLSVAPDAWKGFLARLK